MQKQESTKEEKSEPPKRQKHWFLPVIRVISAVIRLVIEEFE